MGVDEKATAQGKELETVRQALLASQQEGKRKDKEIHDKNMENSKLSQQNVHGKNATSNMNKTINDQKKKIEELEQARNEAKNTLIAAANKHKQEIAEAKKEALQNKSGQEEANKTKKELEETKESLKAKEEELKAKENECTETKSQNDKMKANNIQL